MVAHLSMSPGLIWVFHQIYRLVKALIRKVKMFFQKSNPPTPDLETGDQLATILSQQVNLDDHEGESYELQRFLRIYRGLPPPYPMPMERLPPYPMPVERLPPYPGMPMERLPRMPMPHRSV